MMAVGAVLAVATLQTTLPVRAEGARVLAVHARVAAGARVLPSHGVARHVT